MGRCFYEDISPTIRTRTDGANMDFIMEEVKIIKEGNYSPSGHNASSIVSTQGIAPTVMENHGTVTAEVDPRVINHSKGKSDNGWHFEQQVYDAEGIARAVKAGEGSGNIPKVVEPIIFDDYNQRIPQDQDCIGTLTTNIGSSTPRNGIKIIEPISVAMRGRNPDNPSERGKYEQKLEPNMSGVANTITSVQKDSMVGEPMCSAHPLRHKLMQYRIRKLTPTECFRLMGVDDKDIDTLLGAGISNSQLYKMAGNSIVVDVLYHLFRKMFVETDNENDQLCLF